MSRKHSNRDDVKSRPPRELERSNGKGGKGKKRDGLKSKADRNKFPLRARVSWWRNFLRYVSPPGKRRSRKEQAPLPTTLSHGEHSKSGRPRVGTSEVELEQSSLMVINVRRSQCNSRRKKRERSSRKRLARFDTSMLVYMCTYVYIYVCVYLRKGCQGLAETLWLTGWTSF